MAKIIEMTQLSPTMSEGTLVTWMVTKGQKISSGDILAEVETDKSTMELESLEKGILLEILLEAGSTVKIGQPIAVIGKEGEDVSNLVKELKEKDNSQNSSDSTTKKEIEKENILPIEQNLAEQSEEKELQIQMEDKEENINSDVIKASPLAKKLALQHMINLSKVKGSGPKGRIVKKDIETYLNQKDSTFTESFQTTKSSEKLQISAMRKVIATRLQSSKNNIPHFYLNVETDVEPLLELRQKINEDLKKSQKENPLKISINDFIIKATALSLLANPKANCSWRKDHILQHHRIDIGVAVAIENGLLTPYIRNADRLSISEISLKMKELAQKARDRKLKPEEYTDGCCSISNLGMYGIDSFSAIINEPESCILAVGGLVEKPVVKNGSIVCGKTITITLSCDHRVIDGALGAQFLSAFKENIENPYKILI